MTILQLVIIMSCISQYFIISLDSLEGFLMNIMEEETTSDSVITTETNLSLSYLFFLTANSNRHKRNLRFTNLYLHLLIFL